MIRTVVTTQTTARDEQAKIRVLVVDDQELFRRGLTMLLSVEDDIEVVGEASDGSAAATLASDTARPSVVYRRKGYDYGLITLEVS